MPPFDVCLSFVDRIHHLPLISEHSEKFKCEHRIYVVSTNSILKQSNYDE